MIPIPAITTILLALGIISFIIVKWMSSKPFGIFILVGMMGAIVCLPQEEPQIAVGTFVVVTLVAILCIISIYAGEQAKEETPQ